MADVYRRFESHARSAKNAGEEDCPLELAAITLRLTSALRTISSYDMQPAQASGLASPVALPFAGGAAAQYVEAGVSKFEPTYGDLLACNYLLGEFGSPAKALEWFENFPGCMSPSGLLFLLEAAETPRGRSHEVA